ncbi:hypothetical protein [Rhodocyclus tenuis]|uniref:Uncharacterized protein n=1 Tax=Rhodocyclus tenuis TaxID=1066 RepID=A0A840GGM7_RHOTE|nr:hypothetical protein [Rhodocyclus tenuis]MBB4247349.1 hypothetical protein [Rhodocyclus tenuis]
MGTALMATAKLRTQLRKASPWCLLFVWLSLSAAQLWSMEVQAIRDGLGMCSSPPATTTEKGPQWLLALLP